MKIVITIVFLLWFSTANANIYSSIMWCESGDNPLAVNWKDAEGRDDKRPSIGLYQFYWKTWLKYAKIYSVIPFGVTLNTWRQVEPYLYNPVYNAAVAHGMIADGLTPFHWKICYEKYS
mgnify:FL=1